MGLLQENNNFLKTILVRQAINHIAHETDMDKKLVEQIIGNYFETLKHLFIIRQFNSITAFCFGRFIKKLSTIEKAQLQLEEEKKLREQELCSKTYL